MFRKETDFAISNVFLYIVRVRYVIGVIIGEALHVCIADWFGDSAWKIYLKKKHLIKVTSMSQLQATCKKQQLLILIQANASLSEQPTKPQLSCFCVEIVTEGSELNNQAALTALTTHSLSHYFIQYNVFFEHFCSSFTNLKNWR